MITIDNIHTATMDQLDNIIERTEYAEAGVAVGYTAAEDQGQDMKMSTLKIDDNLTLTTEHAASSYGMPVLLVRGLALGPADMMPEGEDDLGWLDAMETAEQAVTAEARRNGLIENPLVKKFCNYFRW